MGTFHDNLGPLHGITVVVQTNTPTVYVGRCHEATPDFVLLHDVDEHTDGDNNQSTDQYIAQAAKWGVFKKHNALRIPGDIVTQVTPLNQFPSA